MVKRKRKSPTLASLKKKAWKLLSECIRREATAFPRENGGSAGCYTCPEIRNWKLMQAGHAIPGRTGMLLLDEEIIRIQCPACNIFRRGNYGEFAARLIREKMEYLYKEGDYVGDEPWQDANEWWEYKLASAKQIKKWTRSELEEKISGYKERLASLETR